MGDRKAARWAVGGPGGRPGLSEEARRRGRSGGGHAPHPGVLCLSSPEEPGAVTGALPNGERMIQRRGASQRTLLHRLLPEVTGGLVPGSYLGPYGTLARASQGRRKATGRVSLDGSGRPDGENGSEPALPAPGRPLPRSYRPIPLIADGGNRPSWSSGTRHIRAGVITKVRPGADGETTLRARLGHQPDSEHRPPMRVVQRGQGSPTRARLTVMLTQRRCVGPSREEQS